MENHKYHKKPIGVNGHLKLSLTQDGPTISFERVEYPDEKDQQEVFFANLLLAQLKQDGRGSWSAQKFGDHDFDFLISCDGADNRNLELMEIVIPPKKKGSPYHERTQHIRSCKFASTIISMIQSKLSRPRYSQMLQRPLDLLLYVTHWRFILSDTVVKLVCHWLINNKHQFSNVYLITCIDNHTGLLVDLYPNNSLMHGFVPGAVKGHSYYNLDPSLARINNNETMPGISYPFLVCD